MAIIPSLGVVECPECGFGDAQIRQAKSGFLYRYCPDCNAQYFARTQQASDRLKAKIGPVPGTVEKEEARPPEKPATPDPVHDAKPAKRSSLGWMP